MCKIHQSGQNLAESTCASSTGKTQGKDCGLSSEVARLRHQDGPWTISLFTLLRFLLLFSSPPSLYSEHSTSVQLMSNTLFRNR